MEFLLSLALATCISEPEACTKVELGQGLTSVRVCGLAPDTDGARPIEFVAELPEGIHHFTLEPKCEDV